MPFSQSWGTKLHQIWGGHEPIIDTPGLKRASVSKREQRKGIWGRKPLGPNFVFFSFPCRN